MLPGRLAAEGEIFATDVEVYLEFQHRFAALNRADAIEPAISLLDAIADEVFALEMAQLPKVDRVDSRRSSARCGSCRDHAVGWVFWKSSASTGDLTGIPRFPESADQRRPEAGLFVRQPELIGFVARGPVEVKISEEIDPLVSRPPFAPAKANHAPHHGHV